MTNQINLRIYLKTAESYQDTVHESDPKEDQGWCIVKMYLIKSRYSGKFSFFNFVMSFYQEPYQDNKKKEICSAEDMAENIAENMKWYIFICYTKMKKYIYEY